MWTVKSPLIEHQFIKSRVYHEKENIYHYKMKRLSKTKTNENLLTTITIISIFKSFIRYSLLKKESMKNKK